MAIEHITTNGVGLVRNDVLEGEECFVVPMVMLCEGVLNGSRGPLFYGRKEIAKATPTWNQRPIVVYHPERNGVGISASEKEVLETRRVGVTMNSAFDKKPNKLRSEAWLYKRRLDIVDERVAEAVRNNALMEVSTGLFVDTDGKAGEWKGIAYNGSAINHRPDHLALLPDMVGACSIADGAGLGVLNASMSDRVANALDAMRVDPKTGLAWFQRALNRGVIEAATRLARNEQSHGAIRSALGSILTARIEDAWVEDVYDTFFIYYHDGKLYKISYKAADDAGAEIEGEPEEVVRVSEYRTASGHAYVGNADGTQPPEDVPVKKTYIATLISNGAYVEADRARLEKMDEKTLGKMAAVFNADDDADPEPTPAKGKTPDDVKKGRTEPVVKPGDNDAAPGTQHNPDDVPPPRKQAPGEPDGTSEPQQNRRRKVTAEEYIDNAPPAIRDVLEDAMAANTAAREALIETIVGNTDEYAEDELKGMKRAELERIARLTGRVANRRHDDDDEDDEPSPRQRRASYAGAAGFVGNAGAPSIAPKMDALVPPTMNWANDKT